MDAMPRRYLNRGKGWFPVGAAVLLSCGACVKPQTASTETVEAFEIALPTPADRAAFLAAVREAARAENAHLDAATDEELQQLGMAMPAAKMSMHAAVWRGTEDEETWATIMDWPDHPGRVWIMFARGETQAKTARFRERAMRNIRSRWPKPLSLPIIDQRSIPNPGDLERIPTGYRLKLSSAHLYGREPRQAR